MRPPCLNLVVASCNNGGIGINGQLPWRLRKDMDFFKKITTETTDPTKQNAVIMGRKTWFSIPEKFRPLRNRLNIVLSRELKEVPDGVHIARGLPEAVDMVTKGELSTKIENIHIIGGSSVYKEAMTGPYNCQIYLTRILADFECDTFLTDIDEKVFQKIDSHPGVSTELQTENDINFRFEVYRKTIHGCCLNMDQKTTHLPFDVMAAMCDGNRGMAYKDSLPWPHLREDYLFYSYKISSVSTPGMKTINIRGRLTFEVCKNPERNHPNVLHIVVSNTVKEIDHPNVYAVVPTFDAAVAMVNSPPLRNQVESVWVCGGSKIYQESLKHPLCRHVYLTRIYTDFPADRFFPKFEEDFKEICMPNMNPDLSLDKGIQYQFKVYKRM